MKTSIVILTFNKLEYTQRCIASIRQFTTPATFEIIVVDNNSTDGTVRWLESQKDLTVVFNKENHGFPKGCNQGMKLASGDDVLLLNNDTIVTANWLDNLKKCLYSSPDIGAVGPVTNNCSYYQTISVDYKSVDEMHEFAKKHNSSNHFLWEERLKLIGFCLLVKKDVIKQIGLLDEVFSPGNFEDDDYCVRMRRAGYRLFLCKDTFIHHFGSVSFADNSGWFSDLLKANRDKFRVKWGFDPAYSMFIRHEIVNLMDSRRDYGIKVLEIGCACGATLLQIKNIYKNAKLYGIELSEHAAVDAGLIAEVSAVNIETSELSYPHEFFDFIIMADVLEHLENPWTVLERIRKYLKSDGKILASVPNVAHYSVVRNLVNGHWTYEEAGILDKTHLRYFTLSEINKMFLGAGYSGLEFSMTTVPVSETDQKFIAELSKLSSEDNAAQKFLAYQYVIKGNKAPMEIDIYQLIANISSDNCLQDSLRKLNSIPVEEVTRLIGRQTGDKVAVLNLLAVKNFETGDYENVLPYLNKALEYDGKNKNTLYNLGYVLNAMNERELALTYLQSIEEVDEQVRGLLEGLESSKQVAATSTVEAVKYYVDPSCDIRGGNRIKVENNVVIQKDCWLNIAIDNSHSGFMIELGQGTNIGRRSTISAANKIVLGKNVLLGPNVLITDHNHEYRHVGIPISIQGVTTTSASVYIGDGTWIGSNSIVAGDVKIGKGCVVGANSVVNKDLPDFSVAVGNPAKVVKIFDVESGNWVKVHSKESAERLLHSRSDLSDYIVPITSLNSLQVEVSSACNLKCPQCFNQIDGHKTGFFSKELWQRRINPVLNQIDHIHLVGIGEPLLSKDLFHFIKDAKAHNVKVHTTSNLQLVDEELARRLVTSGLDELSFSCDGATKATYEKIRVKGSFDKLISALDLINKFKKEYGSNNPNLVLNFGAIKSNVSELPQIVQMAKQYNIDSIIAYHDVAYIEEMKNESLYHSQELSDQKFVKAKRLADELGINMFFPGLFSSPIKYKPVGVYCAYPYRHIWIYSDGRVGPCCMDFPDRYVLGNLNNSSIESVWNSKPILSLRKELATNPSYTCRFCVSHAKMDISKCEFFFKFKGSEDYIHQLERSESNEA